MMTIEQLEYGIVNYGTPLYVFDLDKIARTVANLRKKTDGVAQLCFAMKANPFLTKQMAALTDRIEVCSVGEYKICRDLQISPEKLLISGVLKEWAELEWIINECHGACTITVESVSQFCYIAEWCRIHQEPLRVYLRLTSGNQFGMDEQMIQYLISARDIYPLVKIEGIHFFSGTQKRSFDIIRGELLRLDQFLRELEEENGFIIQALEYGPGIDVPYFEGQSDRRDDEIDGLCEVLRGLNWKGRITLEMGRFFVGDAGYYMTTVRDIKTNNQKNYCIVDGGIHQINYDGQIKGMYQPHLSIIPQKDAGEYQEWTICGSLCTVNDVLIRQIRMKSLKIGDVLIFQRTGAYAMTEGMALFLSHALPKVTFFSNESGWRLIRPEQPTYVFNMERDVEDGNINGNFRGCQ